MTGHWTIGSSDPTCVQSLRSVSLMGFEILGFKLKNDNSNGNDKKNELFAISHMFMVQFLS